ncbi:hypothetical protein GGI35DRAFT_476870 [Trichoderma velutinum]
MQAESHRNAVAALALGELAEATARSTPTAAAASPPLAPAHTLFFAWVHFCPKNPSITKQLFLLLYALLPSSSSPNLVIVFFLRNHPSWFRLLFPRPTLGECDAIRLQTALNPFPRPSIFSSPLRSLEYTIPIAPAASPCLALKAPTPEVATTF